MKFISWNKNQNLFEANYDRRWWGTTRMGLAKEKKVNQTSYFFVLYSEPWVPSHFPVSSLLCLHPQNAMNPGSAALKILGPRPEPAWEPSHSGWFWDFPHMHTWYSFPASTCIGYGLFCGISGSGIFFFSFILFVNVMIISLVVSLSTLCRILQLRKRKAACYNPRIFFLF